MTIVDTDTQSFTLTVDGTNHTMVLPLSIRHTIRLRTEVGWSQRQLLGFMDETDLDVFAVCVWLARLQAGETIPFTAVADTLTYASEVSIGVVEDTHPES